MKNILEVLDVKKTYYKGKQPFMAVNGLSFSVGEGECLGLVGESGCGKSTAARIITGLEKPDSGSIRLEGREILDAGRKEWKRIYSCIQMVFQTPQDSFDPRQKLEDGILEALCNQGLKKREAQVRIRELLEMTELEAEYAGRYPHQVSGGQCQRAAIARALAVSPKLLICDEATSALDVTVQAQIVDLLKKLQRDTLMSYLMISHDLALVQAMCDRVLVMYQGRIIEEGTPDEAIRFPREEYTRVLVDSVF